MVALYEQFGEALQTLLARYGLKVTEVAATAKIPGSYWGETEAGLVGDSVVVRRDTPVHSVLHEACHYVCMDAARRQTLHTDAAGDYMEENAVCYLQILLSALVPEYGRAAMLRDMDAWGYTFRLGTAAAWFAHDAEDAHAWLVEHRIVDEQDMPTWHLRQR